MGLQYGVDVSGRIYFRQEMGYWFTPTADTGCERSIEGCTVVYIDWLGLVELRLSMGLGCI